MKLDPHEAAARLFKMRNRSDPVQPVARQPVTGVTKPPLPYRHDLIGMPMPAKPEEVAKPEELPKLKEKKNYRKIAECVGCHKVRPIVGRGRCSPCYNRLPDVKRSKRVWAIAKRADKRRQKFVRFIFDIPALDVIKAMDPEKLKKLIIKGMLSEKEHQS